MFASSTSKKTPRDYTKPATLQKTFKGDMTDVYASAVLPDGRLASGDFQKIKIWDLTMENCVYTIYGAHSTTVSALAVLPDDRLASGSWDTTIKVWDLQTGTCVRTLEGHKDKDMMQALAVLPDGRLASGAWNSTIKVWDLQTGTCVRTLEGHKDKHMVNALAVLADGRLVSGSSDQTIKMWDLRTGSCVRTLVGNNDGVVSLALLSDGRLACGLGKEIKVWDLQAGTCVRTLEGHSGMMVQGLAVLPDGRLASGGATTIKVWDLMTGTCVCTVQGHSSYVQTLTVLPDGRLVSGSKDSTIKVWEFPVREETFTPTLASPFHIAAHELKEERKLGQGGYGEVYLGVYRYQPVAIKKLLLATPTKEAASEFEKEAEMMSKLRSPYIVQLYGICLSPRSIVMEYMPKGSLHTLLHSQEPITWEIRTHIGLDVAKGLAFLHSAHIIHRDLKSENVLLDNSLQAKLCDFGLAKIKTETASSSTATIKGTVAWMPPELFMPKAQFNTATDIYSYGVLLWEITSRKIPCHEVPHASLIPVWVSQGYRDTIPSDIPVEFKPISNLIDSCWKQTPAERPSADKVIDALQKLSLFASNTSKTLSTAQPLSSLSGPMYLSNFGSKS